MKHFFMEDTFFSTLKLLVQNALQGGPGGLEFVQEAIHHG